MASEDFDKRIRDAFDAHEPEVRGDWKRMQAALLGAAGGTTAAVVRARWVGVASGATAVVAVVTGWLQWNAADKPGESAEANRPQQQEQVDFMADPDRPAQGATEAKTRTEVVISKPLAVPARGSQSSAQPQVSAAHVTGGSNPVTSKNEVAIESSVQEACAGTEVSFSLEGEWAHGSILWNFGDGSFSNEVAPVHVFAKPGTYDITISMRSPNDGAIRTRTVEDMIVVRPKPVADFGWSLAPTGSGSEVHVSLLDRTEKASSATWMRGAQPVSSDAIVLQGAGDYPITLVASNAFGCQDVRTETLRVGDRSTLDAPGAFSPDGDGRRDVFFPEGLKKSRFELSVYDREGRLVYRTSDARQPWDGKFSDGTSAQVGSMFTWTAVREKTPGKPEFFSDRVRIER
jgi:gliding motility-associated-like protein